VPCAETRFQSTTVAVQNGLMFRRLDNINHRGTRAAAFACPCAINIVRTRRILFISHGNNIIIIYLFYYFFSTDSTRSTIRRVSKYFPPGLRRRVHPVYIYIYVGNTRVYGTISSIAVYIYIYRYRAGSTLIDNMISYVINISSYTVGV